jgi:hypothetical protein
MKAFRNCKQQLSEAATGLLVSVIERLIHGERVFHAECRCDVSRKPITGFVSRNERKPAYSMLKFECGIIKCKIIQGYLTSNF